MSRRLKDPAVSDDLAGALRRVSRERGERMNATGNEKVADAMGPEARLERLRTYVTWTDEDMREFSEALADMRAVDRSAWR